MTRFLSRSAWRNLSAFAVTAFGAATLLMTAAMPARAANVGPDQRISLSTSPSMPAHCELMNGAEYNTVTGVPARIQIMKSNGVMRVRCMSNDGLYRGAVEVKTKLGVGGIASIPWTAFSIVDNATNGFDDDMANSVSSSVQYPSHIVVPVTMINGGRIIPDAQVATDEDAVANQPLPDVEEAAPESAASPPVHQAKKHKVIHHYHTQDSHS